MKYKATSSIALLLSLGFLASCADGGDGDSVSYRLAHSNPSTNPMNECAAEPLTEDETLAELGLDGQVVPDASLGEEGELAQQVDNNELEMALVGANIGAEWNERLNVLETFYLYDGVENALDIHSSDRAQEIYDELLEETNLRRVGSWLTAERHMFTDRPVRSPEDTAGMSIRVPEAQVSVASAEAIGADPTPVAFGETYTALQQGLVNSAENGLAVGYDQAWDEVTDYVSLTGHNVTMLLVLVSDEWWTSLTADQQAGLEEAVEHYTALGIECVVERDEENLQEWRETGEVEIIEDVDTEAFREAVVEYYEEGDYPWNDDYFAILEEAVDES